MLRVDAAAHEELQRVARRVRLHPLLVVRQHVLHLFLFVYRGDKCRYASIDVYVRTQCDERLSRSQPASPSACPPALGASKHTLIRCLPTDLQGVEAVAVGEAHHHGGLQARDGDPPHIARLHDIGWDGMWHVGQSVSGRRHKTAIVVRFGLTGTRLDVLDGLLEILVEVVFDLRLVQVIRVFFLGGGY